MARCLIIGCGCRGLMLARELLAQGHVVRATTRDGARREVVESSGAECVVGDPDRVGTLVGALEHVALAVILLGSAEGSGEELAALHGSRLDMLLARLTDTTVRGVVYEARGSVDEKLLRAGAERVEQFGATTRARVALIEADPADSEGWLRGAITAVERALAPSSMDNVNPS